jgi:hypothetical protein
MRHCENVGEVRSQPRYLLSHRQGKGRQQTITLPGDGS